MTDVERARVKALLGLGLRARTVVVGVQQVRHAAAKGQVALAVVADDASAHSRAKVVPLLGARRVQVVGGVTAAWLGEVVGREATAAVAVVDAGLARGIREAVASPAAGPQNGGTG
ncbi:MAG TPA: ribosomal L7Ae/L30e/S12e/Gadd45 family protein [Gemmatimonadaceae bacterium]|nr:ribosomal L7Ae/L30e/S12e/Gadd45 family protein [Gemmatimonadaceae bacterium]